jgi:hypothetical protein
LRDLVAVKSCETTDRGISKGENNPSGMCSDPVNESGMATLCCEVHRRFVFLALSLNRGAFKGIKDIGSSLGDESM